MLSSHDPGHQNLPTILVTVLTSPSITPTIYLVNKEQNPEVALQHLEKKIDTLVQVCQNLHEENQQLKSQQAELIQQRSALMEKTEKARTRVEAMISRLKLMEI